MFRRSATVHARTDDRNRLTEARSCDRMSSVRPSVCDIGESQTSVTVKSQSSCRISPSYMTRRLGDRPETNTNSQIFPIHIGWNSSKIISLLVSVGRSLSAVPNIMDLLQGEQPEIWTQSDPPSVDLSVGDIRSQIEAEWLQLAQW